MPGTASGYKVTIKSMRPACTHNLCPIIWEPVERLGTDIGKKNNPTLVSFIGVTNAHGR